MAGNILTAKGHPFPLGATPLGKGINFALRAPKAEKASIAIYPCGQMTPLGTFVLDPDKHKSHNVWHITLEGLPQEFDYSWFFDGPKAGPQDIPFDPARPIVDPYAKYLNTPTEWRGHDQLTLSEKPILKARYCSPEPFDWQGVHRPSIAYDQLVIYEMHVHSFTIDKSSQSQYPGTYLGIIEKIPYLKELGINAVELMPIYEFDETSWDKIDPITNKKLCNYWGYSTMNFFCPMKRFASAKDNHAAIREFKTLVRELHRAGIEVILDVVYNHTAEGHPYPIFCFKGIDNPGYYLVDENGNDMNFSGTGNTFSCNLPLGQELILHSLRYWADEMQVDGFRFDLASILTRGENGAPLPFPPLLRAMAHDPHLRKLKLIAEGWDAAGLYQLGQFPSWGPWAEWNGRYRDSVRRFIKGTDDYTGAFATAICGSQDLYGHYKDGPIHSINFVTCHDGFTLRDLVSYQDKNNLRNGEDNRDGNNQNDSWNCGAEGPTDNPEIEGLRARQMRNMHLALVLSLGVPMVLMGDEYGHTKLGNNNTWCQDNELNWFDWDGLEKDAGFYRFFRQLIAYRKRHPLLSRKKFLSKHDIAWHGPNQDAADWGEKSRFLSATLFDAHGNPQLYFAFNAGFTPVSITLPSFKHHHNWHRVVDTSLASPEDFCDPSLLHPNYYSLPSHSAVLFESK